MPTAKPASFKLSASSSSNTHRLEGEGDTISVAFPYVRHGLFRQLLCWLFNHGPLTDRFGAPPCPPPPVLQGAVSKAGQMVPTAWFMEMVRAAGTIWPLNDGSVP